MKKNSGNKKLKSIELFAGCGGLALGLEKAGFENILVSDINKYCVATLKHNRPKWNIQQDDVADLKIKLSKNPDEFYSIDLLSGGYPCQAFSYAGKKMGLEDIRGTLFYHFADILKITKPKIFLVENVKGLISHDKGRTLKTMIDIFEAEGYIVEYKCLNAWEYGNAQKRERVVVVGVRKDIYKVCGKFSFPEKENYKPVLKDVLQNVPESKGMEYSETKKKVLSLVKAGGYWRDLPEEVAKEYMGKSFYLGGGKTGIARRISWDEPSLTILCSPSQKQTERCHPDEVRPFTIRESARIQSFPDDWEFIGPITEQYKQIGNAVPVNLAIAIGKSLKNYLNKYYEKL